VVPLWEPIPPDEFNGKQTFEFNNFARIFVEGGGGTSGDANDFPLYVRFLGTTGGGSSGPSTGSLIRVLRLVE
jgi:hypothetical protein